MHNLMVPAALFGLPCLSTQLTHLWQQIKTVVVELASLVPNDLYLPHPELFCPQVPTSVEVSTGSV